ncbi:MAG: hypothetical protein ABW189_02550 [Rickettsiales bacterium]
MSASKESVPEETDSPVLSYKGASPCCPGSDLIWNKETQRYNCEGCNAKEHKSSILKTTLDESCSDCNTQAVAFSREIVIFNDGRYIEPYKVACYCPTCKKQVFFPSAPPLESGSVSRAPSSVNMGGSELLSVSVPISRKSSTLSMSGLLLQIPQSAMIESLNASSVDLSQQTLQMTEVTVRDAISRTTSSTNVAGLDPSVNN